MMALWISSVFPVDIMILRKVESAGSGSSGSRPSQTKINFLAVSEKETNWRGLKRTLSLLVSNNDETDSRIQQQEKETLQEVEEICQVHNVSLLSSPKIHLHDAEVINTDWLNYPFLQDQDTINLLQISKIMFLMRGLSGSGKSTIVKKIQQIYPNNAVCSADNFFLDENGIYHFDADKLGKAHEACQDTAKKNCERGTETVIIDNTNVKYWEAKPYFNLAAKYSYIVIVVTPKTPWRMDPEELCKRNKHGVDLVTIHRKVNMFEDFIPYYYGWFLNDTLSTKLISIGMDLLAECLELYPSLKFNLLTKLQQSSPNGDIVRDAFTQDQNRHLLHCTAKFTGKGRQEGAKEYHKRNDVQQAYGRSFTLTLYGFTITDQTFGARIHLPKEALELFDKPEELQRDSKASPLSSPSKSSRGKNARGRSSESDFDDWAQKRLKLKANPSTSAIAVSPSSATTPSVSSPTHSSNPSITNLFPFVRPTSRGRSAHVTLGTAYNIPSRETTVDLLDICDIEATTSANAKDFQFVKGGKSRCYDGTHCCVYLDQPYNINVVYSGCY